jgi:hypothetical protein
LFTQSSPVWELLLQAFPFPSTLGEVTLHLFSQSSMFIYSSPGRWVFPPLLCSFPPTAAFTNFPTPDCWMCAAVPTGQRVCLQLTWKVGLPPSPVEFSSLCHSHKLSRSWLLGVCGCSCLLQPGLFINSSVKDSPPPPFGAQCSIPSLLHVFIVLISYYSGSLFFSGWGSVCPGGYADLSQGWTVGVPRTA